MTEFINGLFQALAAICLLGVPLHAWRVRGRTYAIFALVILCLSLPGALVSEWLIVLRLSGETRPWVAGLFAYSIAAAGLHLTHLVKARLRGPLFRWLISVPGQAFIASGFIAAFWQRSSS